MEVNHRDDKGGGGHESEKASTPKGRPRRPQGASTGNEDGTCARSRTGLRITCPCSGMQTGTYDGAECSSTAPLLDLAAASLSHSRHDLSNTLAPLVAP